MDPLDEAPRDVPAAGAADTLAAVTAETPPSPPPRAEDAALARQLGALLQLSQDRERDDWTLASALHRVAEVAGEILGVARAGVWRFNDDRSSITCADMFETATRAHSSGAVLQRAEFPTYFAALERSRVLDAADAMHDPRTREFAEVYFREHGVGATLDAPFRWRGALTGLLCCEHVGGPRAWRDDEKAFLASLADALTLALETDRRRATERDLVQKLALIEAQKAAIVRLSTPVLELWDGVLAVPLIGAFDLARREALVDALLQAVARQRARTVLLDLTGVDSLDVSIADALPTLVRAVRLLGSDCVVSGISPEVAQTLSEAGADLSGVATTSSLKTALQQVLRRR